LSNSAYLLNVRFRVQLSNNIPDTLIASQVITLFDPYGEPLGYNPSPTSIAQLNSTTTKKRLQ